MMKTEPNNLWKTILYFLNLIFVDMATCWVFHYVLSSSFTLDSGGLVFVNPDLIVCER